MRSKIKVEIKKKNRHKKTTKTTTKHTHTVSWCCFRVGDLYNPLTGNNMEEVLCQQQVIFIPSFKMC